MKYFNKENVRVWNELSDCEEAKLLYLQRLYKETQEHRIKVKSKQKAGLNLKRGENSLTIRKLRFLKDFASILESSIKDTKLFINNKDKYRYTARFDINPSNIERIKGFDRLTKYGYYNINSNPDGVVKDHRYSIYDGITNKVDPKILGHICNCEFLNYKENIQKGKQSSITLAQLLKEIEDYDKEFKHG